MTDYVGKNIARVEQRLTDPELKNLLDSFKLDCMVRNLTPKTIDVYYERLGYFLEYLRTCETTFKSISKHTVQDYIMSIREKVSVETINGRIRALKRFFNHLTEEEIWDGVNPMLGIKLLRMEKRIKSVVTPDSIQKVLTSIGKSKFEANRNRVLILLLWDGMLRKGEALGLKIENIDIDGRLIKVLGKGRKERMVPLGAKTLRQIQIYLLKWRNKLPGDYLICMRDGNQITERHCHKILQRIGEKLGITLYPHLLRHSAATYYIQQGGNPAILQKIMGHTSLLITQNYLHLSNSDTVNSYDNLSPSNCLKI